MIKNNSYEINICNNRVHIKNYIRIIDIDLNRIEILILNNKLIINGDKLIIRRMDEYELLINGIIKGLEFIHE